MWVWGGTKSVDVGTNSSHTTPFRDALFLFGDTIVRMLYVYTLQDHEKQVQLLVEQLADADSPQQGEVGISLEEDRQRIQSLESKVKVLEKDLFYYKKTSRELKKKLQSHAGVVKGGGDGGGRETESRVPSSSGCVHQDHGLTEAAFVSDSLQLQIEKGLMISGTSLTAGTHGQDPGTIRSGDGVSETQAPPTGQAHALPSGKEQQVLRKQKKQLRQLR